MRRITIMSGPAKFRILAIIVFIAMFQLNGMCLSVIHTNSAELYSGKVIFDRVLWRVFPMAVE